MYSSVRLHNSTVIIYEHKLKIRHKKAPERSSAPENHML